MKIGILGAGNGGTSLAFEISTKGHKVIMSDLPDFIQNIQAIKKQNGVYAKIDNEQKFAEVKAVEEIQQVFEESELVFITTPAYGIKPFAKACKPYIKEGHKIILCPGTIGGALEFKKELGIPYLNEKIIIAETSTLPYAARLIKPGYADIYLFVKKFFLSTLPSSKIDEIYEMVKELWPFINKAPNVLYTSLGCGNPVIHPPIAILNSGLIQRTKGDFKFYAEGVTNAVGNLIKAIDEERLELGKALDFQIIKEPEMGYLEGYMEKSDYYEGYSKSPIFESIQAPSSIDDRFLNEDVGYGLVFWSSLGDLLNIKTPVIDSVIKIASVISGKDFHKFGPRTVEKLELNQLKLDRL